jgi:hypothetical protein
MCFKAISDPPQQKQDDQEQEDQSDSAGRKVPPVPTVGPSGKDTNEHDDQDNKQDDSHDIFLLFSFSETISIYTLVIQSANPRSLKTKESMIKYLSPPFLF